MNLLQGPPSRDQADHRAVWDACAEQVFKTPWLLQHRHVIEGGGYGYGDLPYHWLWKCLVDEMPDEFRFLEIGVFQGQTLSLIQLCAQKAGKQAHVTGITPLSSTGDKYATHPELDYLSRISTLHRAFKIKQAPTLLNGPSFDPRIKHLAREGGPYDLLYVDGCHDYEVVVDDLASYAPMVKSGGYLVVDDAACSLNLPKGMIPTDFFGLEDVTRAVDEFVASSPHVEPVCSVGHVRVFQVRGSKEAMQRTVNAPSAGSTPAPSATLTTT